jgi:murein DD-endopeptidase MepM/ murein hydrolase activator NlpD
MKAIQNLKKYQKETKNWYNKKVKPWQLSPGDSVLKRKRNEDTVGKFQQKWEGPYLITRTNKLVSFHLANMNVEEINHTWNIKALRRYYPLVSKIYFRSTLVLSLCKFQFKCKTSCTLFPLRGRPSHVSGFLMRQSLL